MNITQIKTGIKTDYNIKLMASIFPQPAKTEIVVRTNFNDNEYIVQNTNGNTILNKILSGEILFSINVALLPIGIYNLMLKGDDNEFYYSLFVKN